MDDLPLLWMGIVLLLAAAHVHEGLRNVRHGSAFGAWNVMYIVTFGALAVYIAFRTWRRRRS